jgi:hypothetical protein
MLIFGERDSIRNKTLFYTYHSGLLWDGFLLLFGLSGYFSAALFALSVSFLLLVLVGFCAILRLALQAVTIFSRDLLIQ